MIFIAYLIACSTCFGHHYAHHQELESIIQMVAACRIWCFGFQVVGMVWSWGLCVRFAGMMVPETCWASNKICNKNHLLHLVGILFPHINDDARLKPHQIYFYTVCIPVWHPDDGSKATETCRWVVMYDKICSIDVHLLVCDVVGINIL